MRNKITQFVVAISILVVIGVLVLSISNQMSISSSKDIEVVKIDSQVNIEQINPEEVNRSIEESIISSEVTETLDDKVEMVDIGLVTEGQNTLDSEEETTLNIQPVEVKKVEIIDVPEIDEVHEKNNLVSIKSSNENSGLDEKKKNQPKEAEENSKEIIDNPETVDSQLVPDDENPFLNFTFDNEEVVEGSFNEAVNGVSGEGDKF